MARQMTPAQMVAQFTKWKVDLNLYVGWETRGYGPGSITDAEGIIIHHTGSDSQSDNYLHFLAIDGRPNSNPALNVPAPLCNWSTDMDGDLWLIAAEKANHAGMGSSATLAKVMSGGTYPWATAEIKPGPDDLNGNTRYYGNEVRFDGGQPMSRAQWVTVILSSAAVCDFHDWGAWRVIGHREHTGRKPDPGNTLMYMIRRDVAAALKAGPGNWPVPTQTKEWDEMATKAEVQEASYAADYQYGIDFWVKGTGAALIKKIGAIADMSVANGAAIAALAAQVNAEDVADDAEFRAAVAASKQADADMKASIDKLAADLPKA